MRVRRGEGGSLRLSCPAHLGLMVLVGAATYAAGFVFLFPLMEWVTFAHGAERLLAPGIVTGTGGGELSLRTALPGPESQWLADFFLAAAHSPIPRTDPS